MGGTRTKWAFSVNGVVEQRGDAGPLRKHLFLESESHSFEQLCREIQSTIPRADRVTVGITGVLRQVDQQATARRVISEVWSTPPKAITVMGDIELGYISQFQGSDGVLLCVGTGSIAAYRDEARDLMFVGGKGYLIGDEGGGYWIGSEAIRKSIRFFEETNSDELLGQSLKTFYGIDGWREVLPIVYATDGRSRIANASTVVSASARAGSSIAIDILESAVEHLVRLYELAKRNALSDEIRIMGAVLGEDSVIKSMLADRLHRELLSPSIAPEVYAALHE